MPLCDWWSSWWTLSVCPCCPAPALMCFHSSLSNKQHKSHVEDPSHSRPMNDRKRKFVDSELALDTEGNASAEAQRRSVAYFYSKKLSITFYFSELFQDLSQLQEIWIAEGQFWPSIRSALVPLLTSISQYNFSSSFAFWFTSRDNFKDWLTLWE